MSEVKYPITQRENDLKIFRHENPVFLGSDFNNILPREIKDNVARAFVRDSLPFEALEDAGGPDMFGVPWVYEPTAKGSMVVPGNPMLSEIGEWEEKIEWPNLDDIDWETIRERCKPLLSNEKLNMTVVFSGYFERLISLLDFEEAAMTMIDEDAEDDLHAFFTKLTDYYCDLFHRLHEYCAVDMITFHDDWGHQHASFFSIDTCREKIIPYLTRIVKACHDDGMFFILHSCGKIGNLVPLMVEAGVDKWDGQPLNDIWSLMEKYGDRLCMNYNRVPAPETEEQIDAWVEEVLAHQTPGSGRYIYLPTGKYGDAAKQTMADRSAKVFA